jgi:hypothetical protein
MKQKQMRDQLQGQRQTESTNRMSSRSSIKMWLKAPPKIRAQMMHNVQKICAQMVHKILKFVHKNQLCTIPKLLHLILCIDKQNQLGSKNGS